MRRMLLVIGAALAVAVPTSAAMSRDDRGPDRDDLLAYEQWFVGIGRDLGRIVEEGTAGARSLKAAVGGEPSAGERESWDAALDAIDARIDAVVPPDGLEAAHRQLREAATAYRSVTEVLSDVAEVASRGRRADRTYDRAAAVIQAARARHGLPPHAELPDPDRKLPLGVEVVDP